MSRDPGAPSDGPQEAPSIIDLSDRRPTPKEVPAFALERVAAERALEEDPRTQAFREAMAVFHEGPASPEAQLLARLVELALPELRRFAFPSLRQGLRQVRSLPEARLEEWEKRLGTRPARLWTEPWLDERAFKLAGIALRRDILAAQKGDSGLTLGAELYLLANGRLASVEPVGYWKLRGEHATGSVLTLGHAQLIDCHQALYFFPLGTMVEQLRALLWYLPRGEPLAPPGADLEPRRDRFLALVRELGRAMGEYKAQLRRRMFTRV